VPQAGTDFDDTDKVVHNAKKRLKRDKRAVEELYES
jgi:hypothetical protein